MRRIMEVSNKTKEKAIDHMANLYIEIETETGEGISISRMVEQTCYELELDSLIGEGESINELFGLMAQVFEKIDKHYLDKSQKPLTNNGEW